MAFCLRHFSVFFYSVIPALFLFFGNPNNVAKMAQYNQKAENVQMYRSIH